jgi:hypothetical protein
MLTVSLHGALAMNYICTTITILVLLLRLMTGCILRDFNLSWTLVALSAVVAASRAVVDARYLELGTLPSGLDAIPVSKDQTAYFRTAQILVLVARILVTTFFWLQLGLLLLFYTPFVRTASRFLRRAVQSTCLFQVASYIAVILVTCFECRPFRLYWQAEPRPSCSKAYVQLFTQGISNIILDVALVVISFPLLKVRIQSKRQKLRIAIIYCLGFICILFTITRIAEITDSGSSQFTRSLWASVQELVSAVVANTPTVYGSCCLILRRRKEALRTSSAATNQTHQWVRTSNGVELRSFDTVGGRTIAGLLDRGPNCCSHISEKASYSHINRVPQEICL